MAAQEIRIKINLRWDARGRVCRGIDGPAGVSELMSRLFSSSSGNKVREVLENVPTATVIGPRWLIG
jgi:hypothetical protein